MKKLLIFLSLVLSMQANIFEGVDVDKIIDESAERTNLHFTEKEKELLNYEEITAIYNGKENEIEVFKLRDIENKGFFIISYSVNTFHLKSDSKENWRDYKLNNNNDMITLEYEKDKNIISVSLFENSYYNNSVAVTLRKKLDGNDKGFYGIISTGICKGYKKYEVLPSLTDKNKGYEFINPGVFYKDYSLVACVGFGYSYEKLSLETNLFGNAVITSLKYKF